MCSKGDADLFAMSQSTSMKTTKRGRPFLKDTLDIFATFIVSLQLSAHTRFFRTFPNSFTADEAAQNLASLRFSQSNRGRDPKEPSRVVTTTTTTTLSMTRDMAKAMSQHFMDARLIENATDPSSNFFKDWGVYMLTPKGLHVLERFISMRGIKSDHLQPVFGTQPICAKLLHLERRSNDDEIIVTQSVITALFRRFVGRQPNYPPHTQAPLDAFQRYHERSKGVTLNDVTERAQPLLGKSQQHHKYCFAAVAALEWLCDFTSMVGREEAAEIAAQFVRFGLITLVSDRRKNNDSAIIFTVSGSAPGGNSPVSQQGEFRCTAKAIYKITEEGRRRACWDGSRYQVLNEPHTTPSADVVTERHPLEKLQTETLEIADSPKELTFTDAKINRRILSTAELNTNYDAGERKGQEINTDRLRCILEEPTLQLLFREFLRSNFCEDSLSFWLDVEDFKKKFNVTSSAMPASHPGVRSTPGQTAIERHHESLVDAGFIIYNTYLAPSSRYELSIDHGLRNELEKYLEDVVTSFLGKTFQGRVEHKQANAVSTTQLRTMIRLYERIQTHVFHLMATNFVPKFIKTPKCLPMRNLVEDFEPLENNLQSLSLADPAAPPGLGSVEEVGGVYITVSQPAALAPVPSSS